MFWNARSWVAVAALLASIAGGGARKGGVVRYQTNSTREIVVVAHQDDWQLFMGDAIAERASAGDSITFIYLTAGDDGRDSVYWLARERAALASTQVLTTSPGIAAAPVTCSTALVHAHAIRRCSAGATVSWFLRLPDGKRNGAGFARYGNQSLRKLRRKTSASITAADRSASYDGWTDLVGTVSELAESAGTGTTATLHTTDPSIAVNPHDHFDHRMAGLLVNDLRKRHDWKALYYVGYALSTRAANRSADQSRKKTSLFRLRRRVDHRQPEVECVLGTSEVLLGLHGSNLCAASAPDSMNSSTGSGRSPVGGIRSRLVFRRPPPDRRRPAGVAIL